MNTSYNPLHIVNTYGMFGSITKNRSEVIIEGTSDRYPLSTSEWKEYEFFAKPGDVMRRPPFMAPYHRRLDWLMWFAAMGPWQNHPWFLNLTAKLLANNPDVLGLIKKNPFSNGPPTWIRATLYHYRLATRQEHRDRGVWWVRERQRPYFPVVSLDDPGYRDVLRQQGWLKDAK